jgi:hypothetical protein
MIDMLDGQHQRQSSTRNECARAQNYATSAIRWRNERIIVLKKELTHGDPT